MHLGLPVALELVRGGQHSLREVVRYCRGIKAEKGLSATFELSGSAAIVEPDQTAELPVAAPKRRATSQRSQTCATEVHTAAG
jgi:hypothetical protein